MKMNKKGFTLIEMLVVIAIIAVLVSIVIPVVGNSTEKAREAADAANIRSIIAELTIKALGDGTASSDKYEMTQAVAECASEIKEIGGLNATQVEAIWKATEKTEVEIKCDADGYIDIIISGTTYAGTRPATGK